MMTWEETILALRKDPLYSQILYESYLNDDGLNNVNRFRDSEEYRETMQIIHTHFPLTKKILELGSGTGMSAAAFALDGYEVVATDPDQGMVAGCEAIRNLKNALSLSNLTVINTHGESLPFENESFDLVYVRQTLHHANDLKKMTAEIARVLKPGGALLAMREHVVFNDQDKQVFLKSHPLHRYYDGENAFTLKEYMAAFLNSGLEQMKTYRYYDSVINYFPLKSRDIDVLDESFKAKLNEACVKKLGLPGRFLPVQFLYRLWNMLRYGGAKSERRVPGRMYSFVAVKPDQNRTTLNKSLQ
jgi:ubiquinone/menaquinone biosynthesis C-methylase UbiE